jgi:small subunit ribosomal protein S21
MTLIAQKVRTGVTVKDNENITQALRRFKRKVEDSGKLEVLRKKEYYEKPTTKRKREAGAAKARYRKKLEKEAAALKALQQYKR